MRQGLGSFELRDFGFLSRSLESRDKTSQAFESEFRALNSRDLRVLFTPETAHSAGTNFRAVSKFNVNLLTHGPTVYWNMTEKMKI